MIKLLKFKKKDETNMKTFKVLKINRVNMKCEFENGFIFDLIKNANSEELQQGETYTLELVDRSITTKYGTDVKYELEASIQEQKDAGIVTLSHHRKNYNLIDRARQLSGQWDKDSQVWVFSGLVADKVEELDEYYNSLLIPVEITFKNDHSTIRGPIRLGGYNLGTATGKKSNVTLEKDVMLISGEFTSGGSIHNWKTIVSKDTIIRLELPEKIVETLESSDDNDFDLKRL